MHECVHLENILNVLRKQHRKAVVSHLPFPWRYQIIDSNVIRLLRQAKLDEDSWHVTNSYALRRSPSGGQILQR
jgi:hypothetical protein